MAESATSTSPAASPAQEVRLSYGILYVANMDASVKFWSETIGWKLRMKDPMWSELEGGVKPKISLHYVKHDVTISPEKTRHGNVSVCAFVDDIHKFHEKMANVEGVTVVAPPTKGPWGIKSEYGTPDSHRLSIVEAKGFPGDYAAGMLILGGKQTLSIDGSGTAEAAQDPCEVRPAYLMCMNAKVQENAEWMCKALGWSMDANGSPHWQTVDVGCRMKVAMYAPDDKETTDAIEAQPGGGAIGLFVDDLRAFHEKFSKEDGVKVHMEPEAQQWGGVHAIYETPFGQKLSVVEAKGYPSDVSKSCSDGEKRAREDGEERKEDDEGQNDNKKAKTDEEAAN